MCDLRIAPYNYAYGVGSFVASDDRWPCHESGEIVKEEGEGQQVASYYMSPSIYSRQSSFGGRTDELLRKSRSNWVEEFIMVRWWAFVPILATRVLPTIVKLMDG